jgi:hypothetical protein
MFGKTFCYVACASDVERAVRATEDIDKGISGNVRGWFLRREMGKIIAVGHCRGSV